MLPKSYRTPSSFPTLYALHKWLDIVPNIVGTTYSLGPRQVNGKRDRGRVNSSTAFRSQCDHSRARTLDVLELLYHCFLWAFGLCAFGIVLLGVGVGIFGGVDEHSDIRHYFSNRFRELTAAWVGRLFHVLLWSAAVTFLVLTLLSVLTGRGCPEGRPVPPDEDPSVQYEPP